MKYDKYVKVESFIATTAQVSDLFKSNTIEQKQYGDLRDEQLYLVVRLMNSGSASAWGELNCFRNGQRIHEIDVPLLRTKMTDYVNIVVPTYHGLYKDNEIPEIKIRWKYLYTK